MKDLLKALQKKFGDDVVMLASALDIPRERIPFGLKSLDAILGGGIPLSMNIEIYGPENVGKTTLAYHLIASAQRMFPDKKPVFVDGEGQWDEPWAKAQGVDPDNLILVRAVPAETALEAVIDAVKGHASVAVLDSVASLEPLKAIQKGMDHRTPGTVPILMNEMLRKAFVFQRKSPTAILILNQLRDKMSIGRPMYVGFEDTVTTPGGRGVKSFVQGRLEVVRGGWYRKDYKHKRTGQMRKKKIGHIISIKVAKTKFSHPQLTTELDFWYRKGKRDPFKKPKTG